MIFLAIKSQKIIKDFKGSEWWRKGPDKKADHGEA
jgi:hypothetical protein